MWSAAIFLVLASSVTSVPLEQGADGTVTVTTEDGLLRGQATTSIWNRTYISFQNIPFAQPPVGELRFKSPRPVTPWTGVRDALEQGAYCYQTSSVPTTANMSEDCLYLNVYIPQSAAASPPPAGLPVMVWIHGGAFVTGGGIKNFFGPDNLMNRTAIMVSINYRLGALGFLSMEHPDITSNAALKDQVAALRWVKRNIAHFGGDPGQVTIFGESAGGISVDMLLLSPMSKGLFQHAISQSGSAIAVNFKPGYNATHEAFLLGKVLGFNGISADGLVKFLRSTTVEEIVKGQQLGASADQLIAFPVVDAKIQEGSEVFLPEKPENMLLAGRVHPVPYITGFNSEEGKYPGRNMTQARLDSYNKDPQLLIPLTLNLVKDTSESLEVAAKIKSFYFGNKTISFDTLPQLIDLLSDRFMIYPVYRNAMFHLKYSPSPIYMYMFTYDSNLTQCMSDSSIKGPTHGADIAYLFYERHCQPYNPSSDDMVVIQHFTGMWVDFAQSGDPSAHETVKWTPLTRTNHTYLQLDKELSVRQDVLKERMAFWDHVYDTYSR